MEAHCGFKALKKSVQLIEGKVGTAIAISLSLLFCSVTINIPLLQTLVRNDSSNVEIGPIILYGIISFVLNPMIMLYTLVVNTVFYFVCKSYHQENIDKTSLVEHLDSYRHEGYVPLMDGGIEIKPLNNV
ncbi:hypothetical protein vseg_004937 [Gypsophila vaccaria]